MSEHDDRLPMLQMLEHARARVGDEAAGVDGGLAGLRQWDGERPRQSAAGAVLCGAQRPVVLFGQGRQTEFRE